MLNIREKPDWTSAIKGSLPPNATGISASAERARLGQSSWRFVTCGKVEGWVNEKFLAPEPGRPSVGPALARSPTRDGVTGP